MLSLAHAFQVHSLPGTDLRWWIQLAQGCPTLHLPVCIFCFLLQIKLFNEWYPTWSEEEQDRLTKGVTEMDPDFGTKLMETIFNGPQVNGDTNGTDVVLVPTENGRQEVDEPQSNGDTSESVPEEPNDAPAVQENVPVEIVAAS